MKIPKERYRFVIAFVGFMIVVAAQAQPSIECPDAAAQDLLKVASGYGANSSFSTPAKRYEYVIEKASRPMDDRALRSACYRLANHYFTTNCSDYGYECPDLGSDIWKWPASMSDWIDKLKSQYPILRQCPEKSIYRDDKLPVVRVLPVPSPGVLAQKITGWVELEVDIDAEGNVEKVMLVDSSSILLEASAIDAARRFKYRPKVDENYEPIAESGVKLTVSTNYSILAKFSGCSLQY